MRGVLVLLHKYGITLIGVLMLLYCGAGVLAMAVGNADAEAYNLSSDQLSTHYEVLSIAMAAVVILFRVMPPVDLALIITALVFLIFPRHQNAGGSLEIAYGCCLLSFLTVLCRRFWQRADAPDGEEGG